MKYFFLIALVLCTNAFAKIVDPSETYRFLDTPHFKIVFNAQQQALAVHYSIQLEKAYAFLADRFSERPEKIVVIINDNTDSSNGYATPVPYPHMMIYPVLPLLQEPLGEPSSWSLELVTHEFTHILSFTPTNGFMYALKKIFGTIVVPNALMPLWWLEGVAVYNESTVNQGGRLRSTYQDSVLRSMQAAGNLEKFTIAEINEILPSYPSSRPYLFGSIFWNELIDQKGLSTIDILHQRQGGRIPYFINAPAVDLFGMSYEQLFSQGIRRLSRLYNDQIQTLQKVPPTPTTDLPWNEGLSYDTPRVIATQSPSISSDGKFMAVITTDEYLRKNLKLYQRGTDGFTNMKIWDEDGVEAIIDQVDPGTTSTQVHAGHQHGMDESSNLPSGSIQRVSWFPGKQKIIFDKVALATSFQSFSDLYTFDLETKKTKQISVKQRYREPHVSSDGKTIAFVEVSSGKTKVCLMLLENEKVVCLVESQFDEIYSWPTFLNEKSLLVTRRNSNGVDQLIEVSWEADTMKFREAKSYFALENSKNNPKTSLLR
ncbi:MAG: TolB family protein [Pseudobdellovibrionaceae bacterium]